MASMKHRAIWTSHIRLALVHVPIRVFTALNSAEQINFNQLHKDCHQRLKQKLVCPVHGEVCRENIVKGYEYEKNQYVVVDETDIRSVKLETTNTIDLIQFIRPDELDPIHLDVPYYLAPDGPVAIEPFAVVHEAVRRSALIGIGRIVIAGREKLVALKPVAQGFMFTTLRYRSEVKQPTVYFDGINTPKLDAAQVAMATKLIKTKAGRLDLSTFVDRYQAGLLEVIKTKIAGSQPIASSATAQPCKILSLVDALKQSLGESAVNAVPHRKGRSNILAA
jgi:DNA end-binding protein Ku